MTHMNKPVRVGGAWLAIASFLMIPVLGFHGPIDPDLSVQMTKIADAGIRWSVVHWIAAAALSLYAVTGLVVLTSRSRLTDGGWTMRAWAVLTVGAIWTKTTAVVETTVVTDAGQRQLFFPSVSIILPYRGVAFSICGGHGQGCAVAPRSEPDEIAALVTLRPTLRQSEVTQWDCSV